MDSLHRGDLCSSAYMIAYFIPKLTLEQVQQIKGVRLSDGVKL